MKHTFQIACKVCSSGRYADTVPAMACQHCDIGKYLSDPGSSAIHHDDEKDCLHCPGGTYQDILGTAICKSCVSVNCICCSAFVLNLFLTLVSRNVAGIFFKSSNSNYHIYHSYSQQESLALR